MTNGGADELTPVGSCPRRNGSPTLDQLVKLARRRRPGRRSTSWGGRVHAGLRTVPESAGRWLITNSSPPRCGWICRPRCVKADMRRVLTSVLSLSKGEAARRVRAAEAVGPRTSMLGEVLEPVRPVLAAAQQAGEVSAEKVAIIERALDKVDRRGFDPADIATGEATAHRPCGSVPARRPQTARRPSRRCHRPRRHPAQRPVE